MEADFPLPGSNKLPTVTVTEPLRWELVVIVAWS